MGFPNNINHGRHGFGICAPVLHFPLSKILQGVVVCVTSLVMALAQDHLDAFAVCYTKAVDRLNKVSGLSFPGVPLESSTLLAAHH